MTLLLILLGAALVALAVADAVATTLSAGNGGGPLTSRLARLTWRALRAAARGRSDSRLLSFAGAIVLLVTVLTWVVLLWAGWALIFASTDAAVVDSTTAAPASVAARVYYAGFVVFTLGVGDFVPGSGAWQIATAAASFLGLFLVTLSITYLVSVVSAAVTRRQLARSVHLSGETGTDIVLTHWTGEQVSNQFDSLAQTLTAQILQTTQQHLAYPVLHHFHAADETSSAPRALAALDDALLLLAEGLEQQARPSGDTLARLRRAIEHYTSTVHSGGHEPQDPPLPGLAPLRDAGVPVVDDTAFARAAAPHAERRQQLDALVRADAWKWPARPAA
jgi:hypothetical protein